MHFWYDLGSLLESFWRPRAQKVIWCRLPWTKMKSRTPKWMSFWKKFSFLRPGPSWEREWKSICTNQFDTLNLVALCWATPGSDKFGTLCSGIFRHPSLDVGITLSPRVNVLQRQRTQGIVKACHVIALLLKNVWGWFRLRTSTYW